MGCCISKFDVHKKEIHAGEGNQSNYPHRKEVSPAPAVPVPCQPESLTTSPLSPKNVLWASSSSSCSSASISSGNGSVSSSGCSSSSTSVTSPASGVMDRGFSNEFLQACAKENSHIIQPDRSKGSPLGTAPAKMLPTRSGSPSRFGGSSPARQAIPQLQKQRRLEEEVGGALPGCTHPVPSRCLRPSSPNRGGRSLSPRKRDAAGDNSGSRSRRTAVPGKDGTEKSCNEVVGFRPRREDMDNSLISLDCFIFL